MFNDLTRYQVQAPNGQYGRPLRRGAAVGKVLRRFRKDSGIRVTDSSGASAKPVGSGGLQHRLSIVLLASSLGVTLIESAARKVKVRKIRTRIKVADTTGNEKVDVYFGALVAKFKGTRNLGALVCLGGETTVVTPDGWRTLESLAGTAGKVLSRGDRGSGRWVDARFSSMGVQQLHEITLSRRGSKPVVIRATAEHRWFTRTPGRPGNVEVTTADLVPGDRLVTARPQPLALNTTPSTDGIRHGIIFGDGDRVQPRRPGLPATGVTLYGDKKDLARFFDPSETRVGADHRYSDSVNVRITHQRSGLKELPSTAEPSEYILGFFAGLIATDGTVNKKGRVILYNADPEVAEGLRILGLSVGLTMNEPWVYKREEGTNFSSGQPTVMCHMGLHSDTLSEAMFIRPDQLERFRGGTRRTREDYKVVSVRPESEEMVFCAVVPSTETFVIDDFILTGNCKMIGNTSTPSQHSNWGKLTAALAKKFGFSSPAASAGANAIDAGHASLKVQDKMWHWSLANTNHYDIENLIHWPQSSPHPLIWNPEQGIHEYIVPPGGSDHRTHIHADFRPTRTGKPLC